MATHLTVTSTDQLTPSLRRVHFHSDDLSAFADSEETDRYVKLVFPQPGVDYPEPLDLRALRGVIPAADMPVLRTYTVLFPDLTAGTLAIDFVVHGDHGVAGPWAAAARPGDRLMVNGPGGGYRPDPTADWHLLVGDETAIPAISAALADLPASATARVLLLVEQPGHEIDLPRPTDATVSWFHRLGHDTAGDGLLDSAVRSLDWLPGRVHVFAHGEAQEIMHRIRPHLFGERGLERSQVSISGYWRRGRTEESFREWKSDLARREAQPA